MSDIIYIYIYIINHVSAEALTTEQTIPLIITVSINKAKYIYYIYHVSCE